MQALPPRRLPPLPHDGPLRALPSARRVSRPAVHLCRACAAARALFHAHTSFAAALEHAAQSPVVALHADLAGVMGALVASFAPMKALYQSSCSQDEFAQRFRVLDAAYQAALRAESAFAARFALPLAAPLDARVVRMMRAMFERFNRDYVFYTINATARLGLVADGKQPLVAFAPATFKTLKLVKVAPTRLGPAGGPVRVTLKHAKEPLAVRIDGADVPFTLHHKTLTFAAPPQTTAAAVVPVVAAANGRIVLPAISYTTAPPASPPPTPPAPPRRPPPLPPKPH